MGRLVILSGPSCVGKGSLYAAVGRFYPDLADSFPKVVVYNSRQPRPGETDGIDYHFRTREQIERLQAREHMLVFDVRGDLQAIDLQGLAKALDSEDSLLEGSTLIVRRLLSDSRCDGIECQRIFLSPLCREEIQYLKTRELNVPLPELVTDLMRRKLLRRAKKQKGALSPTDIEDTEMRASTAYLELREAWKFDHVIPNHDGEDSENWDAFYYPLGDARRSLLAFASLLRREDHLIVEKWEEDLIP